MVAGGATIGSQQLRDASHDRIAAGHHFPAAPVRLTLFPDALERVAGRRSFTNFS